MHRLAAAITPGAQPTTSSQKKAPKAVTASSSSPVPTKLPVTINGAFNATGTVTTTPLSAPTTYLSTSSSSKTSKFAHFGLLAFFALLLTFA